MDFIYCALVQLVFRDFTVAKITTLLSLIELLRLKVDDSFDRESLFNMVKSFGAHPVMVEPTEVSRLFQQYATLHDWSELRQIFTLIMFVDGLGEHLNFGLVNFNIHFSFFLEDASERDYGDLMTDENLERLVSTLLVSDSYKDQVFAQ